MRSFQKLYQKTEAHQQQCRRALVFLRGPFLFLTAEWHVNWCHFQIENPYFSKARRLVAGI